MSNKDLVTKILKAIKEVAKETGKSEIEITKAEFVKYAPDITHWELRKAGGLKSIQQAYFETQDDLVAKTGAAIIKNQKAKLNKQYGTEEFLKQEFTAQMLEVISKAELKVHKPLKSSSKVKAKSNRTIVAHVSDTHFGANISANEMGGINKFDWEVASRRMAAFAKQIADYKPQYRKETDLVIVLNGDIIAGVIHNQEWFVDLLTMQFAGTLKILLQFISYLNSKFSKVTVHCTPGNHGRPMHKLNHGRSTTHKWDSYENMIFLALEEALKPSGIKVNVPLTPFIILDIQGHPFFITHGDTVVSASNPGTSINIKSINNQINKLNASELGGKEKFAAVMLGHTHVATVQMAESGAMLLINGCLSGSDPYAQSIGIFSNEPVQQLFEVTPEHAVGDIRFINLKSADKDSSLDKIIEPYRPLM